MKLHTTGSIAAALILAAVAASALAVGCSELAETAEKVIDGKAAELKEKDLPNCSRMLTCCANLRQKIGMPQTVIDGCDSLEPAVNKVIDAYQSGQQTIADNKTTTQQSKDTASKALRTKTQGTLEPGCRCLLEETLGKVSLDGFLTPIDCESVPESGALPLGKECTDVTAAVTEG